MSTSATAACDRAAGRRRADQPLDDRDRGVDGDAAARWPWLTVLVAAMVSSALASLALSSASSSCGALLGLGVELVAGLARQRLRASAGVGQRLLVGRERRVGLLLQPLGLGQVAVDRAALRASMIPPMRGIASLRDDDVERDEEDHQPDELGGEGLLVERRKRGFPPPGCSVCAPVAIGRCDARPFA